MDVNDAQLWLATLGTVVCAVAMAYVILAWIAVRVGVRSTATRQSAPVPPTTILKPLCGAEPALYEHLRTFCEQNCADLQIVFGVHDARDPALEAVERLGSGEAQR